MDRISCFLFDLIPITDEIAAASPVVGDAIQRLGLALLEERLPDTRERLIALLHIACDLGHASPEAVAFLVRDLEREDARDRA